MKQGYWVVRTYTSGIIGEKTKYWVPGEKPKGKTRRKEKAEIKKQENNEYNAIKRMARLINRNFGEGDLLLGLDYSDAGLQKLYAYAEKQNPCFKALPEEEQQNMIYEAAQHEAVNFLRRVSRELAKQGEELKYIIVTSDMDGETKEMVRIHHHLIVKQGHEKLLIEKWKKLGGVDYTPMSKQADYTPIAEYLLKQVRRTKDANKFTSSRNLARPAPKDRAAATNAELRVPHGGLLLYRQEYSNRNGESPYQPQYIRYIIPQKDRQRQEGSQ